MPVMSRGGIAKAAKPTKVVKPQKKAKRTVSGRKHNYESFSKRVARLKIDPVRRTRRGDELEKESSYFGTSLEEWKDLNLSEQFMFFLKEVAPLTESLPMILHNEDRIMDTLIRYIEKDDSYSLEPFLSLLAHFAHDLDVRFEKHFQRAVAAVAHVAAKNPDVEVIEWSFTCLAWLFKYLSRLLVPDLRPLFDLMAPLLGKERQKPFVIRFSAEAMSFLVRKAGVMYEKKREPLDSIMRHMVEDFENTAVSNVTELYAQGLMTLFTESIKGVQRTLHSGGGAVLRSLIDICFERPSSRFTDGVLQLLTGSLISTIHYTDIETFAPVLDIVLEATDLDKGGMDNQRLNTANQLLFTIVGTRKGSRISDWPTVVARTVKLFSALDKASNNIERDDEAAVLNTLALVLQTAPFDAILSELGILDALMKPRWRSHFLPFCYLFAELGHERFQPLLLSHFQRFVLNHWADQEANLCGLLPTLSENGLLVKDDMPCPPAWQRKMLQDCERLSAEYEMSPAETMLAVLCNGELAVLRSMRTNSDLDEKIANLLLRILRRVATTKHVEMSSADMFALGRGFLFLSRSQDLSLVDGELLSNLCSVSAHCKGLVSYWTALQATLERLPSKLRPDQSKALFSTLIECLAAPSHELRHIALQVLQTIYTNQQQETPELLQIALSIEAMPPTIVSARSISSQIRRLALGYRAASSDSVIAQAIPTYCFGLLHLRLAQAWDDAIQALKDMSQTQQAEEVISAITSDWLRGEPGLDSLSSTSNTASEGGRRVLSDFECSNLQLIETACERSWTKFEDPQEVLRKRFDLDHAQTSLTDLSNRAQALRVLQAMPQLAEKRSRLLVPVLLDWAGEDAASSHTLAGEDDISQKWSRKDQKQMLDIFARFQNPRVLFRTADAYRALLHLLSNGDAEIQKSALKALFAWKTPETSRYEEHLLNLLDEARFREEISVFLRVDQEEAIRIEDCATLMPLLLRLLYGRAVARTGSASGKRGQETRRKAIFVALSRFPKNVLEQFIDIALGSLGSIELIRDGVLQKKVIQDCTVNIRKQSGTINMIEDMLDTLGSELQPFATKLAGPVLLCLLKPFEIQAAHADLLEDSPKASPQESHTSLYRAIRQSGYHCLVQLFSSCPDVAWTDHVRVVMQELIGPRLDKLPIETAQSVSGMLRLFSTWAGSVATARFLVEFYPETLERVADCLGVASAKDEVKLFVIEHILGKLLDVAQATKSMAMDVDGAASNIDIESNILEPNAKFFVGRIGEVLRQNPPKELLDTSVSCISRLAPMVKEEGDIKNVIDVAIFLLRQPTRKVYPSTKTDLLQTLCHLIPVSDLQSDEQRFDEVYRTLCPLFAFFRDRPSRSLLSQAMVLLSRGRSDLEEVAALCEDLNSYSSARLDEPDFERRSNAFAVINDEKFSEFSAVQWRPLVQNMLFHIRDNDELAIRTSASFTLRRFIESASKEDIFTDKAFEDLVSTTLLPGLQKGMRETSELVRTEYLAVMAKLIKHLPTWPATSDMRALLANDDEEASFFTNILHIQQHRRLRALRRLASEAKSGPISSSNVSHFFIPLLEHFIFDAAGDESAHNLASETINSLSALSESLDWSQYRTTLTRFISYVKTKPDLEKIVLKLVSAVIDGLHRSSQHAGNSEINGETAELPQVATKLRSTLPEQTKLAGDINRYFLPPLTVYLHLKDEATVPLRVPVSVAVVKLLKVLPAEELSAKLPSVLMDVCHILRSRNQDFRDMTRKTLATIADLLGPNFFGYILKELRSALQRGYQLHVLSYTMHSILVENSAHLKPGDLDFCLPDVVSVIMDDIFGATGQEKDAEEYISKMKEVKSSKSFDSMELVAKISTLPRLSDLIRPIQTLLMEKIDLKSVKKIDELMRRIGLGTTQNQVVNDRDVLVFCYEIVQQVAAASAESAPRQRIEDYKTRKYLIQMQGANKSGKKGATSSYLFKLTRFAFDLVRSVLQRHEDLKTPANLTGFLPVIGDALVTGSEEVQLSAVRLITSIMKVPAPKIESDAPVYAAEAVRLVRAAPSTTTELAQAALKLVAAVLRDRPNVRIRDTDLAYVLKRIKPDLEEPDRQGVIFNFLKAVLSRKIVITEVYEVLDTVAAIMVTNHTRAARDLARGLYFQFIMEYPQGKDRLSKQVSFLVKNLEYQYVEGRESVLELVHLLLSKTQGDLVQELSAMMFVPIVMVLVNDESPSCREMAGALISKILERSDEDRRKNYQTLMRTWLEQDEQLLLRRVALQCWTMYFGVAAPQNKDLTFVMKQLAGILPKEGQIIASEDWELLYYALQAFAKITETASSTALSTGSKPLWTSVFRTLLFPHTWVKLSAARLVGALFADLASTSAQEDAGLGTLPLRGSGGLRLSGEEMHGLCSSSARILNFPALTEQLATQTARNLIFLGRCFGANGMLWSTTPNGKDAEATVDESSSGDDDSDANDDDVESNTPDGVGARPATALAYILNRLSAILRRDLGSIKPGSLLPKTAALQATAALINALPVEATSPTLVAILLPLAHLTDATIPAPFSVDPAFNDAYKALVALAHEVMALLQKKLGSSEYVKVMGRVQRVVRERREGRRVKRRIERVSMPDKAAREKKRRFEGKRARRKEKSSDARGLRRGW